MFHVWHPNYHTLLTVPILGLLHFSFLYQLISDIALIKNNAVVGSCIAVALNRLQRGQGGRGSLSQNENTPGVPRPVSTYPCFSRVLVRE